MLGWMPSDMSQSPARASGRSVVGSEQRLIHEVLAVPEGGLSNERLAPRLIYTFPAIDRGHREGHPGPLGVGEAELIPQRRDKPARALFAAERWQMYQIARVYLPRRRYSHAHNSEA